MGLPWWRSGWESACQCRGHGFEPWSGKIPHAAEQLGPWATTTEPVCLEPVLRNKRGRDSERPMHCDEEWPPLATTRESPRTETKTQHTQKNQSINKFKKKKKRRYHYDINKIFFTLKLGALNYLCPSYITWGTHGTTATADKWNILVLILGNIIDGT